MSDRALEFVRDRGGELWVWLDARRCCSGTVSYLGASCEEPPEGRGRVTRRFRTMNVADVRLHASLGYRRPPDELHVELKGRLRPRIEAYWNGCIFVDDRGPVEAASDTGRISQATR